MKPGFWSIQFFWIRAGICVALALRSSLVFSQEPFQYRGYYFILSRNPGYGLADYRRILDCMAADRANLLILWIGGGFPSKRFPETWDYNREHRNCVENFAGAAIDYAHQKGIGVLLGLTPFAYDGVNRYGLAHPELGATGADGKPAVTGGIHSMGRGLCPSKAAAREFMLVYCRELFDDFYPNAGGFFLEHSDYGTCQCKECAGGSGLRREWQFVEDLSRHVWEKNPAAIQMIYPQYADLGVEYDKRYIVFLAPHNMKGADKVRNPKVLWNGYWDTGAFFKNLCREAARAGYAGVIPSMENFTYEHPYAFDTRWGPAGSAGWDDILVRVSRLSFREFAARPSQADDEFKNKVKAEFFDASAPSAGVDDLLALHRLLNRWESWTFRGGVASFPKEPVDLKKLDLKARYRLASEIMPALREIQAIVDRYGKSPSATAREMVKIAAWILKGWEGKVSMQRGAAFAESARPDHFPHRIWAACDFEGQTPDYGWFGTRETENIPRYPGNSTALRGQPAREHFAHFAGINPVPGPRMGKVNQVYFRYYLKGADSAQVQHFNLSKEDNHHIAASGLKEGSWSEATLNFTFDSRRNDGAPGAMEEGDRMDDLKIFLGKEGDEKNYELLVDDVILFADDPSLPLDPEPFPKRVISLWAFDTGEKGMRKAGKQEKDYWPGEFEIAEDVRGGYWRVAHAVERKDERRRWIRLEIAPPRPVGARTRLRFRYFLKDATAMTVQIFDLTARDNRHIDLHGLPEGSWQSITLDFTRDSLRNDGSQKPLPAGHQVDDLFFFLPAIADKNPDLWIDEVVLYDGGD